MAERIWTNNRFDPPLDQQFADAVKPREVLRSADAVNNYIAPAKRDEMLASQAEIAFGQPDPDDLMASPVLRFVQLTTAGYTRYDREDFRAHVKQRGIPVCNASSVYDEPCAQHAVAFMLGAVRQLPEAMRSQIDSRGWPALPLRARSVLLDASTTTLIVGYGAIARRLVELLTPYRMTLHAFRRKPRGDENVATHRIDDIDRFLPQADHVMNILPLSDSTKGFFDATRLAKFKPGARFYNIGRGDTVDQPALISALKSGHLSQAYLDVTSPEPLPTDHPLWTAPHCYITPHTAGGWATETEAQIANFLANLKRFDQRDTLKDRIM